MKKQTLYQTMLLIFFIGVLLQYFVKGSAATSITFLRVSQISGTILFLLQVREIQSVEGSYFLNPHFRTLNILHASMFLGTALHFIYYGELSLSMAYGFAGAGVALFLVRHSNNEQLIRYMMSAVFILFIAFVIFNVPARFWGKGSENQVSVMLIYLVLLYYVSRLIGGRLPNPVWALLVLLLSLFAQGRGGIMSSSVLLAGILTIRYTKKFTTFGIALFVSSFFYFVFFDRVLLFLESYLSQIFDRPLFEDPRMILNAIYLDELTFQRFIYGAEGFGSAFSYNLLGLTTHNSFLSMHATFGVFFLTIMGALIWLILKNWRRQKYASLFLLVVLLRCVSDTLLFTSGIELTTVLFIIVAHIDYGSSPQQSCIVDNYSPD